MKNLKLSSTLLVLFLNQNVFAAPGDTMQKIGEANGKVTVTKSWVAQQPDGSYKFMLQAACKLNVKIPIVRGEVEIPEVPETPTEIQPPMPTQNDVQVITVGTCKSATQDGKPVELTIYSVLSQNYSKATSQFVSKTFASSYVFTTHPKAPHMGGFNSFSTKDKNLTNGSVYIMDSTALAGTKTPEDLNADTFFAVSVEFQE